MHACTYLTSFSQTHFPAISVINRVLHWISYSRTSTVASRQGGSCANLSTVKTFHIDFWRWMHHLIWEKRCYFHKCTNWCGWNRLSRPWNTMDGVLVNMCERPKIGIRKVHFQVTGWLGTNHENLGSKQGVFPRRFSFIHLPHRSRMLAGNEVERASVMLHEWRGD